jgi:trk system potassium uptake protein TrkH
MINFRTVLRVFGALLMIESGAMAVTLGISFIYGEEHAYSIFLAAAITFLSGFFAHFAFRNNEISIGRREGYIIVTGSWILFSLFGTLPFILTGSIPSFTDAFFETMSGFTTTGASISGWVVWE